jgi:type I restriction enzyme S subunit
MEVKPGYKQTEVGVIPEEWACEELSEFFSFISYGFTNPMPTVHDGVFMITAADINYGRLQIETARKTSEIAYRTLLTAKSKPQKNDILLTKDGTLGRLALVGDEIVCINQSVAVIRPNGRVEPPFLKLLLESPRYQKRMVEDAGGSTIKHIYITIVDKMPLGLPLDKAEQRAIATALSDVDGLLGGLDRIIAKKRDLKQAAMQQLLTGQTRLPGFSGEWEKTTLGQIGECIIGLTYKPENVVEHGLLVLRSSNVQNGRLAFDDNVHVNLQVSEHLYTRLGDILICVRNGSRALIGKCAVIDSAAVSVTFGAFMSVYRTKHWRFVLHAFQADSIQRQIRDNIGATINQITNKDMKAFRLCLPSEEEQTAIAGVLTEMDAELAALEQRREKTRALKQAMMQELLTGRIRLV